MGAKRITISQTITRTLTPEELASEVSCDLVDLEAAIESGDLSAFLDESDPLISVWRDEWSSESYDVEDDDEG